MMSPLSVAQYLDPTNEELQFDVVIFDGIGNGACFNWAVKLAFFQTGAV